MSKAKDTDKDIFKKMGLTKAEQFLWERLRAGGVCIFDENAAEGTRTLRGDILGKILRREPINGVEPLILSRQVRIKYAIISGVLDMSDSKTELAFYMENCQFNSRLNFTRSSFSRLDFEYSQFDEGASFDDLVTKSHLWLDHLNASNKVSLYRARIGGHFTLCDANVSNPGGDAINAQGSEIKDGVFLRDASLVGCVDFNNAVIGYQFVANGATFSNPHGTAVNLQGSVIDDSTWFVDFPHPPVGALVLINASLGHVVIDSNSHPLGEMALEGATYRNIRDCSCDEGIAQSKGWLKARIDPKSGDLIRPKNFWDSYESVRVFLGEQLKNENLLPEEVSRRVIEEMDYLVKRGHDHSRHPNVYREFARVLDANGHEREARDVRIEAGHAYTDRIAKTFSPWRAGLYRFWRWSIRHLIGYGIKPWRIIPFMLGWWVIGSVVFTMSYDDMTPAREKFYLTGVDQTDAANAIYPELSPTDILPKGYPDYSPVVYALDVMLPVVDFAQESHWRPKNVGPKKFNLLRNFNRWFLAIGWAFSTIAVLGFTGLISDRRDK